MDWKVSVTPSARSAGVLIGALLVALSAVVGLARVADRDAAAYPSPGTTATDNSGPAEFLPAPNPDPICDSVEYFSPWELNAAVAAGTAPQQYVSTDQAYTNDAKTGLTATFLTTVDSSSNTAYPRSPLVGPGALNSIGITMFSPAQATVSLSEPVFYSQWVFTDLDQNAEGFEVTPAWASGSGELAIFAPDSAWEFGNSSNTLADFSATDNVLTEGYSLGGRAQVDLFGPVNGFSVLRTGSGGSGFAGGSGCQALGLAKQASAPVFDPATNTFAVDYAIAVDNNLPSTTTLASRIAAAEASAGLSFVSGSPTGIDLIDLAVVDQLDLTGFTSASVTNLTSTEFTVNTGFDGVNDTNLLSAQTLAAESSGAVTFTVNYTPDFADATWDACSTTVSNQAVGTGTADTVTVSDESDAGADPAPAAVNEAGTGNDDPTLVAFSLSCELGLTKSVSAGPTSNGDGTYDVEYTLVAQNTGTAPLGDVVIDDDLDTAFGPALNSSEVLSDSCVGTTLAASDTCTQVIAAVITPSSTLSWDNTATVTAVGPGGETFTGQSVATAAVTESPAMTLLKEATNGPANNGDGTYTVEYTLTAQNTGDTLLTNVAVTDDLASVFGERLTSSSVVSDSCVGSTLNASVPAGSGDTCVQVLSVVFTPGTELGPYANSADVTALSPGGVAVAASSTATVTAPDQNPAIDLVKTASTGDLAVGVVVGYSFAVTNTGDISLSDVAVVDDLLTDVACPTTTLAAGASMTCTGSYTVTQADVDAGTVQNTASASGVSPAGATVESTDSVTYPIDQTPGLSLDKNATVSDVSADGLTNAGDVISYTLTVTNIGNVSQTGIALTDELTSDETCPATSLAPGESMECTASWVITADDVAAGTVTNTATVISDQGSTATDSTSTPVRESPAIEVVKAASTGDLAVGIVVEYTFTVTNTGDVPLASVTLDDGLVTDEACPAETLAVAASMTCTGTHTVTQADVDAGTVNNTASISGVSPAGVMVESSDSVSYPIAQTPGLTLTKTASVTDTNTDGLTNADDVIDYTFTVTNTGNTTQTGIVLDDPLTSDEECAATSLGPGESMECSASWTVTADDVVAGTVENTATVSSEQGSSATDSVSTPVEESPALEFVKSAASGDLAVGVVVGYSFSVTNIGDVPLGDVVVDDDLLVDVSCPTTSLAVGASMTCTGSYTITQADVDAGTVQNTASVSGASPAGETVSGSDSVTYPIDQSPGLSLDKTASVTDTNSDGLTNAGDVIDYSLVVTNTGNITQSGIVLDDPLTFDESCPDDALAPGASMTCTASWEITADDVESGTVDNTASVTSDQGSSASASTSTPTEESPGIELAKSAATGDLAVGVVVDYTLAVTNTGDVGLDPVLVQDPLLGDEACPRVQLGVGESMTCTGTYTVTQADVDAGTVNNTASVSGVSPAGATVESSDSVSYPIDQSPGLDLTKTASVTDTNDDGLTNAGDVIRYALTVTNTGNTTQTGIVLVDDLTNDEVCPEIALAPAASMECTASWVITTDDVAAGRVDNTATVTSNQGWTATDETSTPIQESPAIDLVKTASTGDLAVGVVVGYSFVASNVGDVALREVVVVDELLNDVSCPETDLAVGASMTCTGSYRVTQRDVDAGIVQNSASVTGVSPAGTSVDGFDAVAYPIERKPAISLEKSGSVTDTNRDGLTNAPDVINYTLIVTNIGNVTQTGIGLDDALTGDESCPGEVLAPGESMECTASWEITPDDVVAGVVDNTATVRSDQGSTATDSASHPVESSPKIELAKTVSETDLVLGRVTEFLFVVTNTGDVGLREVALEDPMVGEVRCPASALPVEESMMCAGSYTVTQADVDAGMIENTASVRAAGLTGGETSGVASVAIPQIPQKPGLTVVKGDPTGTVDAESLLRYPITATNTGDVTLSSVTVADSLSEDVICDGDSMAPGESVECVATYVVTQQDVDSCSIVNVVSVAAADPNGVTVQAQDSVTTATDCATPPPTPTGTVGPTPTGTVGPTPTGTVGPTPTGTVGPAPTGTATPARSTPTPVPAKPPLAFTGTSAKPVALAGVGFIVIGLALVGLTSRRPS